MLLHELSKSLKLKIRAESYLFGDQVKLDQSTFNLLNSISIEDSLLQILFELDDQLGFPITLIDTVFT